MIDNCYTYYAIILPTAVGLRLFKVLVAKRPLSVGHQCLTGWKELGRMMQLSAQLA